MAEFSLVSPLYEDDGLLVYPKPAGLAVIPERWEDEAQNLVDMLRQTWPQGVNLHRIDKDASGLVAFAKTPEAARFYHRLFDSGGFAKTYQAIAWGRPAWTENDCNEALLPDGDRQHRTVCHPGGKSARSVFRVLEAWRDFCLLEVRIHTGRTHQIRAHARFLGHPLVGDQLYGGKPGLKLSMVKRGWKGDDLEEGWLIQRCALHAFSLAWTGPDGTAHQVEAPWPKDFATAVRQLKKWN